MRRIREYLSKRRITTYCVITFALTWTFWFAAVYPRALPRMSAGESPLGDPVTVLFVGAGMFFPCHRLSRSRGCSPARAFANAWIRPVHFRQTWRYYLIGWFGPIALVTIGAIAYFALNPGQFDTSMSSFAETARQMESAGQPITMSSSQIAALGYAQLALVIVAPLLNCVSCFGEEWGGGAICFLHRQRGTACVSQCR